LVVTGALVTGFACNVFTSIDRCDSDGDCPTGTTCDPEGRFCLKASIAEAGPEAGPDADAGFDAPVDAGPCDLSRPFENPKLVSGLEDVPVISARLTSDESSIILSLVTGSTTDIDLYTASRKSGGPFGAPAIIKKVNAPNNAEFWPTITRDLKIMFFESSRSLEKIDGSYVTDQARIWYTRRDDPLLDWDEPSQQETFKLPAGSPPESSPYLHPGGRAVYFMSYARNDGGSADIHVAVLNNLGVESVRPVAAINTEVEELAPLVTLQDTTLYFARSQTANPSLRDIWFSTRALPGDAFGAPSKLPTLDTEEYDELPNSVSDDQCRLYFTSDRPHGRGGGGPGTPDGYRLWIAERPR